MSRTPEGTRRARGEGTMGPYKGKWRVRWPIVMDDGSRKYKTFILPSKGRPNGDPSKEAAAKLAELQQKAREGVRLTARSYERTVQNWTDEWAATRGPRSAYVIERRLAHIVPLIKDVRLADLSADQVRQAMGVLQRRGVSSNYQRAILAALRSAMAAAVRRRILGVNVASEVEGPPKVTFEAQILHEDEIRRLIDVARDGWFGPMVVIAVLFGPRRGELLALEWRDINWERQEISITKAASYMPACKRKLVAAPDGPQLVVGPLKTKASRRVIAVGTEVMAILDEHRRRIAAQRLAAPSWADDSLVFPTREGRMPNPAWFHRWFMNVLRKAQCPDIRFHDLRHTAATNMLRLPGANYVTVSRILGHASPDITLKIYGHIVNTDFAGVAQAMDGFLGGAVRLGPGQWLPTVGATADEVDEGGLDVLDGEPSTIHLLAASEGT